MSKPWRVIPEELQNLQANVLQLVNRATLVMALICLVLVTGNIAFTAWRVHGTVKRVEKIEGQLVDLAWAIMEQDGEVPPEMRESWELWKKSPEEWMRLGREKNNAQSD